MSTLATTDAIKEYTRKNAAPEWQSDKTYNTYDIAFRNGSVYKSVADSNINHDPNTDQTQTWWMVTGGGIGGNYFNYVKNADFDTNFTYWSSSSASLVFSLDNITPIAGRNSFVIEKAAVNLQDEYVFTEMDSYDLTVNDLIQISFDMKISDINHKNDWDLVVLDNSATNIVWSKQIIPKFNTNGIAPVSFIFETGDYKDLTLRLVLNTPTTDTFETTIDDVYLGKPNWFSTSGEGVVVGSLLEYAGTSIDPSSGWLMADYTSYDQADYPDLFSIIGYSYSKTKTDTANMVALGKFRVPDGTNRVTRGAIGGEITFTTNYEQVGSWFSNCGRTIAPVRFSSTGTMPTYTSGGLPVQETDTFFAKLSGNIFVFYPSEADAQANTNIIAINGDGTGTLTLSSIGTYEDDQVQAHTHEVKGKNVDDSGTNYLVLPNNTTNDTSNLLIGNTEGQSGRAGGETRVKAVYTNLIIRWKPQRSVEFLAESNSMNDAGSLVYSGVDADAEGKDKDGNLVIGGLHVYLISEYPELWVDSSTPKSKFIVGCDSSGTGSADGIHFKTVATV